MPRTRAATGIQHRAAANHAPADNRAPADKQQQRFDELGLIGEGSYGVVVRARDRQTGRLVALKKFFDSTLDSTTQRELEALRRLNGAPGVCALVASYTDTQAGGHLRIAMEYVGGGSLLDQLKAHPRGLPWARARAIVRSLCEAVGDMHVRGVMHRDLKPENVLLCDPAGTQVKLCDLGDAAWTASGEARTSYVATRWYRSPEQLCREPFYGPAVDVWALGCIGFELVTGDALFCQSTDAAQVAAIQRCLGPLPKALDRGFAAAAPTASESVRARLAASPSAATEGGAAVLDAAESFLHGCLCAQPRDRLTATTLLAHDFVAPPPRPAMGPSRVSTRINAAARVPTGLPAAVLGLGRGGGINAAAARAAVAHSPPRRLRSLPPQRCDTPASEVEEEEEEVEEAVESSSRSPSPTWHGGGGGGGGEGGMLGMEVQEAQEVREAGMPPTPPAGGGGMRRATYEQEQEQEHGYGHGQRAGAAAGAWRCSSPEVQEVQEVDDGESDICEEEVLEMSSCCLEEARQRSPPVRLTLTPPVPLAELGHGMAQPQAESQGLPRVVRRTHNRNA